MGRSRALKICAALGAALLLVAGGASAAQADQLQLDGDGIGPVGANAAMVEACNDEAVQFTVLIAARRNGNPNTNTNNNVFANSSSVNVGFSAATAGMSAVPGDGVIALPSDWQAEGTQNDLSDEVLAAIVTIPAQAAAGTGTVTFSYAGVNNAGAVVSGTSAVTVNWTTQTCITDSTAPQLTLPSEITVEATSAAGAPVDFAATATDETAPAVVDVTCSPASGSVFPLGTSTVSCSATDAAGNTRTGSFDIVVRDTTAPAVGAMSDIAFEADGEHTIVTWTDPTATDAVAGAPPVTCTPPSATGFLVGSTTVTCTATDAAGNTGSASFTVTISDTSAPSLVLPADITIEATGPTGAAAEFEAAAFDLVDGDVEVTCAPASGAVFALGDTTVDCTTTDSRGNTATGSFLVNVVDTTAPDVSTPASFDLEATGPDGAAAEFTATAEDLVDGALTPVCVPASGSTLPLGVTTVTCTATDAAGNTGSSSFAVTVVDTTPPGLQVPESITVEATGPDGAVVDYAVTAVDLVDGAVEATCEPASGSTFALGGTQVDCTATDAAGNSAGASFPVLVVDTTAPEIDVPETIVVEATGPAGATAAYAVTASDIVDGVVAVTCLPASGTTFPLGTTSVDCAATDAAGNTGHASFDVVVEDTTAPVITWIGGPAHGATYVFGSVPAAGSCTASDIVDGAVPCAITGYAATVGPHTLTATASDAAGNGASDTRSYSVAAWTLGGFFQPVDMGGVWNSVKGGATVPLKFEVLAGATELTATSAVGGFTVKGVSCPGSTVVTDDIELTTTGATSLRYDVTAGQFIQNWQTPKKPGACYQVIMTTQDGSSLSALFKLK